MVQIRVKIKKNVSERIPHTILCTIQYFYISLNTIIFVSSSILQTMGKLSCADINSEPWNTNSLHNSPIRSIYEYLHSEFFSLNVCPMYAILRDRVILFVLREHNLTIKNLSS